MGIPLLGADDFPGGSLGCFVQGHYDGSGRGAGGQLRGANGERPQGAVSLILHLKAVGSHTMLSFFSGESLELQLSD